MSQYVKWTFFIWSPISMRPTVHGTLQHIYMYLTEKTNIMIIFLCGAATKAISAMGIVGQSFLGNLLNLTSTTMEDLFNNIIQILHTHTNTHTHTSIAISVLILMIFRSWGWFTFAIRSYVRALEDLWKRRPFREGTDARQRVRQDWWTTVAVTK